MAVPTVVRGRVYPVAGYDSMLLNLAGAHGPYFTRDVVVLEDSAGNLGIGEVPGGPRITQAIEDALSLVIGQPLSRWRRTVQQVQNAMQGRDAANIFWTYEQTAIHAITAIETALLDLFGKYLGVPGMRTTGRWPATRTRACSRVSLLCGRSGWDTGALSTRKSSHRWNTAGGE